MIETILVATDGSDDGGAAERMGIALAARLHARLSGITVIEDRAVRSPGDAGLGLPAFPETQLATYYKARAEALAKAAPSGFGETDLPRT